MASFRTLVPIIITMRVIFWRAPEDDGPFLRKGLGRLETWTSAPKRLQYDGNLFDAGLERRLGLVSRQDTIVRRDAYVRDLARVDEARSRTVPAVILPRA